MIQFNLLPDVKIQFIKAQRAKRMAITISVMAVIISFGIAAILFAASKYQEHNISNLNTDIKKISANIKSTEDITKILTIQNQLNSLPNLYSQRPVTSRLFSYIQSTTPAEISIDSLILDFTANTLEVQGKSSSLENVNKYVDTLKFTNYTEGDSESKVSAFTGVILSAFSRDDTSTSFTVKFTYASDIFDSSKKVTLIVPKTITTRSETQLPGSDVFTTEGSN